MSLRAYWFTHLEEPRQISASSPAPLDAPGRLLALDLGAKRIGVAVSDELRLTTRPLPMISRADAHATFPNYISTLKNHRLRTLCTHGMIQAFGETFKSPA